MGKHRWKHKEALVKHVSLLSLFPNQENLGGERLLSPRCHLLVMRTWRSHFLSTFTSSVMGTMMSLFLSGIKRDGQQCSLPKRAIKQWHRPARAHWTPATEAAAQPALGGSKGGLTLRMALFQPNLLGLNHCLGISSWLARVWQNLSSVHFVKHQRQILEKREGRIGSSRAVMVT